MRIKHLPWILGITVVAFLSSFVAFNPGGAPAAKTGSPGDGSNCTECHGGTAQTVAGWITSNIPAEGYTPGTTYQITASNQITGSGKFGFEVSPQNVAGTLLGTLTAGSNNHLVGSNKYVTHNNANTTTSSWTFSWTAPAAGTGAVTFYGAFARNKPGPVRLSTLLVNEATVTLPSAAGPISGASTVCKNNSSTYTVGTIANATTYNWTVPAGATITAGQGTTSITVNFGASAVSGNISVYGSNSGGNGAPSSLAVTVNSVPAQPSAVAGVAAPCQGTTQSYSVTNVAGVIYTWTVPAGTNISAGQGTNSITVTIGGTNGSVTVVPSNSCGNGSSSSLNVSVSVAPGQAATPAGPDIVDLALATSSQYITTGAAGASTYEWSLTPAEAGSISGTGLTATVSWNAAFLGNAEVSVKASNDCGAGTFSLVKQTQVINTTGIAEGSTAITTSVYPNPSNGKFSVLPGWDKDNVQLMILDASGREMYRKEIDGRNITNLELPLRPGIYILMLTDGIKASKTKLFIQ